MEDGLEKSDGVLKQLAELDIDIDEITRQLEDEGVEKFNKPFDSLMETLREKCEGALKNA